MTDSLGEREQPFEGLVVVGRAVELEDVIGIDVVADVAGVGDVGGEPVLEGVDTLGGLLREDVVAPHTGVLLAGRLLLTPRTDDGARVVWLVGGDVQAVGTGDLPLVGVVEDGDVPRGDVRPARPAVVLLEVGLRDALAGQVAGRGLPEVRRRDGLVDAGAVGDFFEDVADAVVRDGAGRLQAGPQRVRVAAWVVVEPAADVRHGRDEDGRAAAHLAVERDLQAVVVARDRADGQVEQLARPRAEVPRQCDERPVARVEGGVDHGLDVVGPVEHVRGVGCGIVAAGIPAGNPVDALGELVAVGDEFAELAEGDAVVLVCLRRAVLLGVDVADESLGGVSVVGHVGEPADLPREDEVPPQQLLVLVVTVLRRPEQADRVAQLEEDVGVGTVDVGVLPTHELLAHGVDSPTRVVRHRVIAKADGHVKVGCGALPGHYSETLHAQRKNPEIAGLSRCHCGDESHTAIDTSAGSTGGASA